MQANAIQCNLFRASIFTFVISPVVVTKFQYSTVSVDGLCYKERERKLVQAYVYLCSVNHLPISTLSFSISTLPAIIIHIHLSPIALCNHRDAGKIHRTRNERKRGDKIMHCIIIWFVKTSSPEKMKIS